MRSAGRSSVSHGRRRASRGFSLLEVVLLCSIVALIVAATAPMLAAAVRSDRIHDTIGRMDRLADAIQKHHDDTKRIPAGLGLPPAATAAAWLAQSQAAFRALISSAAPVPGWRGPYLDPGTFTGSPATTQVVGYRWDGFGNEMLIRWKPADANYAYTGYSTTDPVAATLGTAADQAPHPIALEIVSAGEDGVVQTAPTGAVAGDDIVRVVNLTGADRDWRVAESRHRLQMADGAVNAHRRSGLAPVLPTILSFYTVPRRFLSEDSAGAQTYRFDAWGHTIDPDTTAGSPSANFYFTVNMRRELNP